MRAREVEWLSDDGKGGSWWQTLPGTITALTATVTALAGLVVAVQQTGWFIAAPAASSAPSSPATSSPGATVSGTSTGTTSAAGSAPASRPDPAGSATARAAFAAPLPSLRDHKLGLVTISFLRIDVAPRTTENDELTLRLRMTNHDRYDKNFWDESFRLVVAGVPRAPESHLNEVVPGESAKDGDVLFVIPRGTTAAQLRIRIGDTRTEVPLDLRSAS